MDEKDQNALDERRSTFPPQPAGAGDGANGENPERADAVATDDGRVGTLSEPDKVRDAVVPLWTKFADLSIEQKFEQARLIDFKARDAYLRERCRAAKLEVAHAESALNRATEIIETNLPFFLVHFEELDAQGERSDLKSKVTGKTEWLRQNLPDISKGTFYAAFNAVKARYAEQTKMLTEGHQPEQQDDGTQHEASGPDKVQTAQPPSPSPKLKLTQKDINRLINTGREAARAAEIGLKQNKTEDDYEALHASCRKIAKLVEPQKLDSLMAESANEAEADIQRGKAINAARRLAELALGWCKVYTNQVRADSTLLRIGQAAQAVMNLIEGTHDKFVLPEIGSPAYGLPPAEGNPPAKPAKPKTARTEPLPVSAVVAKPGCTCKFSAKDCEITGVSDDGMCTDLRVAATGEELRNVPVAELRYISDPDAAEAV